MSTILAGIDLAWVSTRNPTAIAVGTLSGHKLVLQALLTELYGVEQIVSGLSAIRQLHGVTVDGPRWSPMRRAGGPVKISLRGNMVGARPAVMRLTYRVILIQMVWPSGTGCSLMASAILATGQGAGSLNAIRIRR